MPLCQKSWTPEQAWKNLTHRDLWSAIKIVKILDFKRFELKPMVAEPTPQESVIDWSISLQQSLDQVSKSPLGHKLFPGAK